MLSYHPVFARRSQRPQSNPTMTRIDVATPSRPYAVTIEGGAIEHLARLLDELHAPERRFVVSSPLVWRLHGTQVARAINASEPILVPDGERFKQLPTVARIYDALVRANADRATTLVTFGGGVIGDMAGFAAATYLRGVALVHVPTTLLAQVDSAIGGKVGVNHPLGKNLIGAFYQPHAVVIDPQVLGTLPRREFRAGLYEVIKYGMTSSAALFDRIAKDRKAIFARAAESLTPVIAESCRIKATVVSADEREAGPRRILNFGHTVGHALEALTGYRRFRHGEAVGWGMLVAGELSKNLGLLDKSELELLRAGVRLCGPLPTAEDLDVDAIIDAITRDKKSARGHVQWVLLERIGRPRIVSSKEIDTASLRASIRAALRKRT